jgi:hypothetical protein
MSHLFVMLLSFLSISTANYKVISVLLVWFPQFGSVFDTHGAVFCLLLCVLVQVPLFDQMDDSLLDAMCERLKPALNTQGTYIVHEGDPVNEMLFIIRGRLESVTTNGGRTGFFNSGILGPGDFCGEELLTWALDPKPSNNLPISTRTVEALVEVEAFALFAEDLKFVASQFRRLHSKQLQHTFRFLLLFSLFLVFCENFTFPCLR